MPRRIRAEDRKKGQSVIEFPDDYIVLDLETTGYDPHYDEIIEICATRCVNNVPVEKAHSLIRPTSPIPDHITTLTGITNDMVINAPPLKEALPILNEFLGDHLILGQCVYFDINFIHDAYIFEFGEGVYSIMNDYVDLNRIAKKLLPNLENYKLSTIANSFGFDTTGAHRADFDCHMTHLSYQELKKIAAGIPDIDSLFKSHRKSHSEKLKASDIQRHSDEVDPTHPLYGETCVFTGKLEKLVRKEAMQLVVDLGGHCGDTVTKQTNYLILGDYDYCKSITDGKSSKHKKAEKLKAEGQHIEIITESVFYDMVME